MTSKLNLYGYNVVFDIESQSVENIGVTYVNDYKTEPRWLELGEKNLFGTNGIVGPDNGLPIVTMENLEVTTTSTSNKTILLEDHVFVFDANQSFFHCLYDNLGQFLVLKNYFPDIKAVFVNTQEKNSIFGGITYKSKILEWAGIQEDDHILTSDYKTIKFKKISFIHSASSHFLRSVDYMLTEDQRLDIDKIYRQSADSSGSSIYLKSKFLKKFIRKNIANKNIIRNRKVYLSRVHTRKLYERTWILKNFLRDNGVIFNNDGSFEDENNILLTLNMEAFKPANIFGPMMEIDYRYLEIHDELFVENFFRSKGYEIVSMESMELVDQVDLMLSCTHIATLAGAGSLNALFLDDDGLIIYLAPNSGYSFHHEDIIDSITKNSIILQDKREIGYDRTRVFQPQQLIHMLEEAAGDRL